MLGSAELRELLMADVALRRGLVDGTSIAEALRAPIDEGEPRPSRSRVRDLAERAGAPPASLRSLEEEVDALLARAGGDARVALAGRGTLTAAVTAAASSRLRRRAREALGAPGADGTRLRSLPEGRYVEFLPVGEGGMGIVWAALDTELHRIVALKMIRPEGAPPGGAATGISPLEARPPRSPTPESTPFEELRARFLQEAWVTGGLEHPGVVPVHELGETPGGIPYYTMRLLEGHRTLATALREAREEPIERRLLLLDPFLKLCDTVAYAHARRVLHRDIKPENVSLGQFGEVILLDWGLAKLEEAPGEAEAVWQEQVRSFRAAEKLCTVAGMLGTPGHMAPEALLGIPGQVGTRSDVYSLGVILYEILTGRLPHSARDLTAYVTALTTQDPPPPVAVAPTAPEALSDLCRAALARDPRERLGSAEELSTAIRRWQATSAVEQEVALRRREAGQALERAERLAGDERLAELEQAGAALSLVRARRPDDPESLEIQRRVAGLREEALAARERANVRRARRRAGALATAALLLLAGLVFGVVRGKEALDDWRRREDLAARERAAASAFAHARTLPAAEAIAALEGLLRDHPDSAVSSEARLVLAERFAEADRTERAQQAWMDAWVHGPAVRPGQRGALRLGRTYLAEGRLAEAEEAASAVLRYAVDAQMQAEASLLKAEALWGRGLANAAATVLEEGRAVEAHLSPADTRRLARLRRLLPRFQFWWQVRDVTRTRFAVGRFRPDGVYLASLAPDGAHVLLRRIDRTGAAPEPTLRWEARGLGTILEAVDTNRDGRPELLQVDAAEVSIDEARRRRERLRLLDVSGDGVRSLFETWVRSGWGQAACGDCTGDGHPDLVLGRRYPAFGVEILRGDGAGSFSPVGDLGPMEDLEEPGRNVRDVAIGDVTGDGHGELVLACDEWAHFDLRVFTWDPRTAGFRELPVGDVDPKRRLGRVACCVLRDIGDRAEVVFGLEGEAHSDVARFFPQFLPQGVHVATWDAGQGLLRVRPLGPGRVLRLDPAGPGDGPPTNLGNEALCVLRGPAGPEYLLARGSTRHGSGAARGWLALRPWDALDEPPFVIDRSAPFAEIERADINGDGADEILVSEGDGVLAVLGTVELAPPPAAPAAPSPPASRGPLDLALEVADRRLGMGFVPQARADYEDLRARARRLGDTRLERTARRGLLTTLERTQAYDECLDLLEDGEDPGSVARREDLLYRIQYLDWTQQWTRAAEEFRNLKALGGPPHGDSHLLSVRAEELDPWLRLEEVPLGPPASWAVSTPGHFHIGQDRIQAVGTRGKRASLLLPPTTPEASFSLSFDLTLHELSPGHVLQVGFLGAQERALNAEGPFLQVDSSNDLLHVAMLSTSRLAPLRLGATPSRQRRTLEAGTPYRVALHWDERGRRTGVTIRRRDSGKHFLSLQARIPPRDWRGPWRLEVQMVGEGHAGRTDVEVARLEVRRPREAGPIRLDPVDLPLERGHALLARGDRAGARAAYEEAGASEQAEDGRRVAARFLAALLAWEADPTEERLEAALSVPQDGFDRLSSFHGLLLGAELLLSPPQRRAAGEALFLRTLERWRRLGPEADGRPLEASLTTALWCVVSTEQDPTGTDKDSRASALRNLLARVADPLTPAQAAALEGGLGIGD